jgi:nanoRNase/pAp phosphatase (c-di-AMP/oligoRNAs hydrolase)
LPGWPWLAVFHAGAEEGGHHDASGVHVPHLQLEEKLQRAIKIVLLSQLRDHTT